MLLKWADEFPEDFKAVVTGFYVRGLKGLEVAEELGVTEARVCQMHAEIIEWFQNRLRWLGEL